jgi:hypothetical protein
MMASLSDMGRGGGPAPDDAGRTRWRLDCDFNRLILLKSECVRLEEPVASHGPANKTQLFSARYSTVPLSIRSHCTCESTCNDAASRPSHAQCHEVLVSFYCTCCTSRIAPEGLNLDSRPLELTECDVLVWKITIQRAFLLAFRRSG